MNNKPSYTHPNRKAYNWSVYNVMDRCLIDRSNFITGTVYDLGCGEMPYREWLLQYADSYVGVDWSATLHELMADIVANLNERLPIDSEVADTVISLSVLEHLSEPQLMLNEAFRILKTGGRLVLQVPWQWWVHEAPHDFFRFTPFGLEYLLQRAGFSDIKIEPQAGFFTTIILKTNYFSLRLIRGPRPIHWLMHNFLSLFWYFNQKLAPHLDKLDRRWELETSGYFVTARKP